jgi:hypothetical protein
MNGSFPSSQDDVAGAKFRKNRKLLSRAGMSEAAMGSPMRRRAVTMMAGCR